MMERKKEVDIVIYPVPTKAVKSRWIMLISKLVKSFTISSSFHKLHSVLLVQKILLLLYYQIYFKLLIKLFFKFPAKSFFFKNINITVNIYFFQIISRLRICSFFRYAFELYFQLQFISNPGRLTVRISFKSPAKLSKLSFRSTGIGGKRGRQFIKRGSKGRIVMG